MHIGNLTSNPHILRRIAAGIAALLLCCTAVSASAEAGNYYPRPDSNSNHNDYLYDDALKDDWSQPVNSYLIADTESGTLTALEYADDEKKIYLDTLKSGSAAESPALPEIADALSTGELRWGGFFAGADAYYFALGRDNPAQDDTEPVLCIYKYDKSWQFLGVGKISSLNSYQMLQYGSLRMTEANGLLYIHTCHANYAQDETSTQHHQSNLTVVIDESRIDGDVLLEPLEKQCTITTPDQGFISHSFNQFAAADDDALYRADHGDAYNRAVVVTKSPLTDPETPDAEIERCTAANVIPIGSDYATSKTATGLMLGGMELSDTNVLLAYSSIDQAAENWDAAGQHNIYVTAADKNNLKTVPGTTQITNYAQDDNVTVHTPHLVKASDKSFAVLWTETAAGSGDCTYLAVVDGNGNITQDAVSIPVRLSDCQPAAVGAGQFAWFVTENAQPVWYLTDIANRLVWQFAADGTAQVSSFAPEKQAIPDSESSDAAVWKKYIRDCKSIEIAEGITAIGKFAFANCSAEALSFPLSLETIGASAFRNCSELNDVVIPENLTEIKTNAFKDCSSLKNVVFLSTKCTFAPKKSTNIVFSNSSDDMLYGVILYPEKAANYDDLARMIKNTTKEQILRPIPRGDNNCDGEVGVADAQNVLNYYVKGITSDSPYMPAAQLSVSDVDRNGAVSVADAQFILNYYVQNTILGSNLSWDEIIPGESDSGSSRG